MNNETILEEAARLVNTDRRADYGDATESCVRVAKLWTVLLENKLKEGEEITADDYVRMMIAMKLSRDTAGPKRDNLVDVAGYAYLLEMVRNEKTTSHGEEG